MAHSNFITAPGSNLEVVISFDTTCSMNRWLNETRNRIQDLIQRLQADIPGIRIAVFAHGDYCSKSVYVTKWLDFTGDIVKLCDFVKNVETTWGGDGPECYELVLEQVRTKLSWTSDSRRVLVMIGDSRAHEFGEVGNKENIDWKTMIKFLGEMGVTIYGVQCGHNTWAETFYKTISMTTGGKHLRLEEFDSLFHTIMAVCYREANDVIRLANYEKEVRANCERGGLTAEMEAIFTNLRGDNLNISTAETMKSSTSFTESKTTRSAKIQAPVLVKRSLVRHAKKPVDKKPVNKKTAPKKKFSFSKFKESSLPLLKRENVPENNFNLRSLRWSSWIMAMTSGDQYFKENEEIWEPRAHRPGYRLKILPLAKSSVTRAHGRPALFEVAVQGNETSKKRYIVFSAFSSRSLGVRNWERNLFGVARSQIDLVLNSGGRVLIRFCLIGPKSMQVTSQRKIRRYDYAWRKVRRLRQCPRDLIKGNVVISKSGL